jgi:hypothetical protein
MNGITRHLAPAAIAVITIVGTTAVRADDGDKPGEQNSYVVTPLVAADYVHALRLQEAAAISGERQVRPADSGRGAPKDRDAHNALLSEPEREFITTFAAKAVDDDPNA